MYEIDKDVLEKFKNIRVNYENGNPSLHKPVLLLIALSFCYKDKERLIDFKTFDTEFQKIFNKFSLDGKSDNSHYPFGKLENDGIWEVQNSKNLKRTSVGHLSKKELIEKNIHGGFNISFFEKLNENKFLISKISEYLIHEYLYKYKKQINGYLFLDSENGVIHNSKDRKTMAFIGTNKFAISKWWLSRGIEAIQTKPDIFSTKNVREATKFFIAGSGVIKSINNWMLATQIIKKGEEGLTDFGLSILHNDPKLLKSSTWWAIHLSLCFSERGEPYTQLFKTIDCFTKDWISWKEISEKLFNHFEDSADQSVESNLDGVKKMFQTDNPLSELGLIEIRKENPNFGMAVRLGSPKLTDEIIIHALALCRFAYFKSRQSVDYNALADTGIIHFLCCSKNEFRQHLQRMTQMHEWQSYFSFDHAVDLDSISFKDGCTPDKTLLLLLQKGQDTWM